MQAIAMPNSNGVEIPCGQCRLCRASRLEDLIGRALAEQRISSRTMSVTLTYAGDGPSSAALVYSDVQKFIKRLRKEYSVRYFAVGEHGSRKARAHWHCILFFRGVAPDLRVDSRQMWRFWPHGFVYPQHPDYQGFRYALKYVLKHQTELASRSFRMSKYPPIGSEFFLRYAEDLARDGLALHSPEYSFSDVTALDRREGRHRPRLFWLRGRTQELFVKHYADVWRRIRGEWPPYTEFFDNVMDRIARREAVFDPADVELFEVELERRREEFAQQRVARVAGSADENQIAFLTLSRSGGLAVLFASGKVHLRIGDGEAWLLDVKDEGALNAQIRALDLPVLEGEALYQWCVQRYGLFRPGCRKLVECDPLAL